MTVQEERELLMATLQAFATELRCPVCLGLVRDGVQLPCLHIACESCWQEFGRREAEQCFFCKVPTTRRQVKKSALLAACTEAFQVAVDELGFDISGACHVREHGTKTPPIRKFEPLGGRQPPGARARRSTTTTSSAQSDNIVDTRRNLSDPEAARQGLPTRDPEGQNVQHVDPSLEADTSRTNEPHMLVDDHDASSLSDRQLRGGRSSRSQQQQQKKKKNTLTTSGDPAAAAAPPRTMRRLLELPPEPPRTRTDGGRRRSMDDVVLGAAAAHRVPGGQVAKRRRVSVPLTEGGVVPAPVAPRAAAPAAAVDAFRPTQVAVGDMVQVAARTWPGINKPGGVGRVTAVHSDGSVDVKYVLSGSEHHVRPQFVQAPELLDAQGPRGATERTSRSSLGGSGSATSSRPSSSPAQRPTPPRPSKRSSSSPTSSSRAPTSFVAAGHSKSSSVASTERRRSSTGGAGKENNRLEPSGGAKRAEEDKGVKGPPPPPSAPAASVTAPILTPDLPTQDAEQLDSYSHRPQEIVVLTTKITPQMQSRVQDFVLKFNARLAEDMGPDVTHVICKADLRKRAEKRTLKYMHGLLQRRWLVSTAWITDSLARNKVVFEKPYELSGDPNSVDPSVACKARLSRYKGAPPLFSNWTFGFYGSYPEPRPSKRDLERLVESGGGSVETDAASYLLAKRRQSRGGAGDSAPNFVIICNCRPEPGDRLMRALEALDGAGESSSSRPHVVSSDWLLDSISNHRMQSFHPRYDMLKAAGDE